MCEFLVGTGGCVHATTTGGATPLHRGGVVLRRISTLPPSFRAARVAAGVGARDALRRSESRIVESDAAVAVVIISVVWRSVTAGV